MDLTELEIAYSLAGNKGHAPDVRELIADYKKLLAIVWKYGYVNEDELEVTSDQYSELYPFSTIDGLETDSIVAGVRIFPQSLVDVVVNYA